MYVYTGIRGGDDPEVYMRDIPQGTGERACFSVEGLAFCGKPEDRCFVLAAEEADVLSKAKEVAREWAGTRMGRFHIRNSPRVNWEDLVYRIPDNFREQHGLWIRPCGHESGMPVHVNAKDDLLRFDGKACHIA